MTKRRCLKLLMGLGVDKFTAKSHMSAARYVLRGVGSNSYMASNEFIYQWCQSIIIQEKLRSMPLFESRKNGIQFRRSVMKSFELIEDYIREMLSEPEVKFIGIDMNGVLINLHIVTKEYISGIHDKTFEELDYIEDYAGYKLWKIVNLFYDSNEDVAEDWFDFAITNVNEIKKILRQVFERHKENLVVKIEELTKIKNNLI